MTQPERELFARDDQAKDAALLKLRARLAAATPPTRARPLQRLARDWPRSLKAAALILLLSLMLVAGSGLFG
ncbi:hypothetical protein [Uliginosibacterium aquaticum]|uniref:DUF3040 domain-containing protein n=1 Tax=Uliginosibacterium aquaticum TaxID=2731212 RepID=A0ABX2IHM2_9RHOO|nr:hypothetical protein [Uliginosibacterium aquaticum]NSL55792.1 hypothetical protein [Uliginosibacterium aquaticum]